MASAKPSLTRLETKAVEEEARSKSARQQWRKLFEDFCEWIRSQGQEVDYLDLDNQLSEYLRGKYFEGKPRSFAVNLVKAVKFEVPAELGRDGLWRARSACARWDSAFGPWTESDPEKARATVLFAFRTPALLHFLGSSLGIFQLLAARKLFQSMPTAVDGVIGRCFKTVLEVAGPGALLDDFKNFFTQQMFGDGKDGPKEPPRHPAIRLIIENSPALLQLEMSGSASWQIDGHFALFGQDLCDMNSDTMGLLFQKASSRTKGLDLQEGNNLQKTMALGGSEAQVLTLGQKFRHFLDPHDVSDVLEIMNPGTLSIISQLFPDAKYDVALVRETFDPFDETAAYNMPETHFLHQIRGSAQECYLTRPNDEDQGWRSEKVNHLLKTQAHLDPTRVTFYTRQLQEALKAGQNARPTALVFDFFTHGQIHDVQEDEDDSHRGPGGRRKQKRRVDACDEKFLEGKMKAWFLLDGHHKVEAAAQLGCSLNFLVISPCAEPYLPLEASDEFASAITRRCSFPLLWPAAGEGDLCIRWSEANLCRHSPLLLSSAGQPPQDWQDLLGCQCFRTDESFPSWALSVIKMRRRPGRQQLLEKLWEHFGKDHPLFTTHMRATINELPEDLQIELYSFGYGGHA